MSEKTDKVTIVKPEVKVEVEQKISQQDVIELVAYKQIKNLETQKKETSDELDIVKEQLKDLNKKFNNDVIEEVSKLIKPFTELLTSKLEIRMRGQRDYEDISPSDVIRIEFSEEKDGGSKWGSGYSKVFDLDYSKLSTTKTETHIELETKRNELEKSISDLDKQIHQIQHDKNSIKNAITEQLLTESEDGKSLLALVENAFTNAFPKQLK